MEDTWDGFILTDLFEIDLVITVVEVGQEKNGIFKEYSKLIWFFYYYLHVLFSFLLDLVSGQIILLRKRVNGMWII